MRIKFKKALLTFACFLLFGYFFLNSYQKKTLCIKIPVRFSSQNTHPVIDIFIGSKCYASFLDLGSSFPLTIREEVFNQIKKKPYKTLEHMDFKGNIYYTPSYFIPRISIGSFVWKNILSKKQHFNWEDNVSLWEEERSCFSPENVFLTLGLPILKKTNMLLDFPNQTLYFCNSIEILQKKALLSTNLIKIPFNFWNDLILIEAETSFGKQSFIFDTGASISILHMHDSNLIENYESTESLSFVLGSHDFGKKKLYKMETSFEKGFLGIDFIKKFPIYIDYRNKILYIDISNEK